MFSFMCSSCEKKLDLPEDTHYLVTTRPSHKSTPGIVPKIAAVRSERGITAQGGQLLFVVVMLAIMTMMMVINVTIFTEIHGKYRNY